MAKRSIISDQEIGQIFKNKEFKEYRKCFNDYIFNQLKALVTLPRFNSLKIFLIGSASYQGLTPYSDLDLLAVGDRALVGVLSEELNNKFSNLKIKYQKTLDWENDQKVFDHISLFFSKAIKDSDQKELDLFKAKQVEMIYKDHQVFIQALNSDREQRHHRYGKYAGQMNVNLKYGPGGLRDLCQSLACLNWFGANFADEINENKLLHNIYSQLLEENQINIAFISDIRFYNQYFFKSESLNITNWPEFTKALNWNEDGVKEFYQKLLKDANACHTSFESFTVSNLKEFKDLVKLCTQLKDFSDRKFLDLKKKDLRLLIENRHLSAFIFSNKSQIKNRSKQDVFQFLDQQFAKPTSREFVHFIFDSGVMNFLFKEWSVVDGLIQSDHYHRFTVSEHLRQSLLAVCDSQTKEKDLFRVSASAEDLDVNDWRVLKWTAVFHDMCKGHKDSHSELGYQVVKKLKYIDDQDKEVIAELVRNHLGLSNFSFRFEHSDREQLKLLNSSFKVSHWIRLLLVFTCADIMASNPEAWNSWKSDQLYLGYRALMDYRNKAVVQEDFIIEGFALSPSLIDFVTSEKIAKDIAKLLKDLKSNNSDRDWAVIKKDKNIWVRVFCKDKGPGTLSEILSYFYFLGFPVEQAFISSDLNNEFAYDWFRLPESFLSRSRQLQKRIDSFFKSPKSFSKELKLNFDKVLLLSQEQTKLSYLFKAKDQSGVLLFISKIFEDLELNILKAQVNTWGERIEDTFIVEKNLDNSGAEILKSIKKALDLPRSIKI